MQPFNFTPKKPLQTLAPLGMDEINALNQPGGSQEPMGLDEWMKQNAGDFDEATHPNTRRFLKGKHRGKTPEQVATKLAQQHAKGLATPMGAIGHGAAGGLDTPTMAMDPAAWKARFHSKGAAATPMAPATMPMQGAQAGVGTVLKPPTGTGTVLANNTPNPLDFAATMMKPPMMAKPAAMPAAPAAPVARAGIPGVKTMSNKYGSGSSYDASTIKPAVATPPVDPLAPALKKNFFA